MTTKLGFDNLDNDLLVEIAGGPFVTRVAYLDSSLTELDDLALGLEGGNVRLTGYNFSNIAVKLDDVTVSGVTIESNTSVVVDMPAKSAGGYNLTLTNQDTGDTTIRIYAIEYSPFPAWSTSATLSPKPSATEISVNLSASSDSNVTYTVATGSTLPGNLTLASNGLLAGNVTVSDETVYTFSIEATDLENQNTNRTFSITIISPDPYFNYTSLLVHANDNTYITDTSDNKLSITPYGDVRPSAFSPYNGVWSNYFDGTGDYLQVAADDAFLFGGDDFTIEAWVKSDVAFTNEKGIVNNWQIGGAFIFRIGVGTGYLGRPSFSYRTPDNTTLTAYATDVISNPYQWNHVAVVRSGSSLYFFVNGQLDSGGAISITSNIVYLNNSAKDLKIGMSADTAYPWQGYISNLRIVKGRAVYTTNFTPPTSQLGSTSGGDDPPQNTETSILTCQSNRFIDNSTNNFTITTSGETKPVSFAPFADTDTTTGSGYFDGTGDYLKTAVHSSLQLDDSDFTLECWTVRLSGDSYERSLISSRAGGVYNGINLQLRADGSSLVLATTTGSSWAVVMSISSSYVPPVGRWVHVALVRNNNSLKLYIDGRQVGYSVLNGSLYQSENSFYIGQGGYVWHGNISNVRITKQAIYTGGSANGEQVFTPPSGPLGKTQAAGTNIAAITDSSKVVLLTLQNRNGHNNSQPIDESGLKNVITRTNQASTGSYSPHALHGWGVYNGNGSFQITNQNDCFNFGSGNLTVEFWAKVRSTATQAFFIDMRVNNNTNVDLMFFPTGVNHGDGTNILSWATAPYTNNLDNWFHYAIVRDNSKTGDNWCAFINGVPVDTGSFTGSINTGNMRIFGRWDNNYSNWNADISNLRVTKSAVYTDFVSGFTTPTTSLEVLPETTVIAFRNSQYLTTEPGPKLTVTAASSTTASIPGPFANHYYTPDSYSVYFDGTGDYLTAPDDAAFDFGTDPFTFEAWIYLTANNDAILVDARSLGSDGFVISPRSDGTIEFDIAGTNILNGTIVRSLNTWAHVVICKDSSNNISLFIDGTRDVTTTSTASVDAATNPYIGSKSLGASGLVPITGYISNLRFVKGSAVYDPTQTTITVPTAPLTAVSGTSLLTCQSPTVIDNSTNEFAITVNGHSQPTKFNPFGETVTQYVKYSPALHGGSVYFDGTDDKLTIDDNVTLELGASDFTIEFWFYYISGSCLLTKGWGSGTYAPFLIQVSGGNILFYATSANGSWNIANGQVFGTAISKSWNHIAVTRSGTSMKGFLNGAQSFAVTTSASLYDNASPIVIGNREDNTTDFGGYISGLRIVKGTAVYTSSFVPPQVPPTPIVGSTVLINGTNAAIHDRTGKNVIIPSNYIHNYVDTANVKYGSGSLYLNGGTTKLTVPHSDSFYFDKEFTFECWLYATSFTEANNCMLGKYGNWYWGVTNTGLVRLIGGGGSVMGQSAAGAISLDTWYHVAVCRDSSNNIRTFINGTQSGITYTGQTASLTNTTDLVIGSYASSTDGYRWYGYLDDIRMSRVARYTADFTPPTSSMSDL